MRPYTSYKISVHDIIYGSMTTHATEFGKITEQIAVQALQEKNNKTIKKCSLFIDRTIPYLAATLAQNYFKYNKYTLASFR